MFDFFNVFVASETVEAGDVHLDFEGSGSSVAQNGASVGLDEAGHVVSVFKREEAVEADDHSICHLVQGLAGSKIVFVSSVCLTAPLLVVY
ncbi:hypothetical protein TRICI_000669 [Trichomonascus ciferrii]|uniref:Uncharacterized protein n=1 Tax=Trichomonascus ciferrii TaxID=44093 RepID=A0A642VBN5_9ASCO|nr:hypothetical protein TRICI_000669 [Trichomonascus ciferrii]